jgi:sortase A
VIALLAIGATVFFGAGVVGSQENPVERAVTPTVAEKDAPQKTEEKGEEPKEEEEKGEEPKEEEEKGEEPKEEEATEDEAAEEQAAADQYAAEQAAVEQYVEEPVEEPAAEEVPETAPAPSDTSLYLSVPKMGLANNLVVNDISPATLDQGAGKLPSSGFPWQPGSNTYIAAHVLGWEGTASWLQFANLPNMAQGDMIYLTDSNGTTYEYQVTEILNVTPYDTWVMAPEPGRDMVSLQTCVGPNYEQRLIVRGDRVA